MEEDLLVRYLKETGGDADYLEPIPTPRIQYKRLVDIEDRIPKEGTFLVTSHYGTLSNAVCGDPVPNDQIILQGARIIHKGWQALKKEIGVYGDEVEKFTPREIIKHRRAFAVMSFLANRALCGMEMKSVQSVLEAGPRKGKPPPSSAIDRNKINWHNQRYMIIEDVLSLFDLPIEKIWEDTEYGFSVPRILVRAMCNNYSEGYLAKANLNAGSEPYQVLGILATRFDKADDIYIRLFPLIRHGEDVAKLVSRAVEILANDYKVPQTILQVFITINALVATDVNGPDKGAAASAEKGIAAIIPEVCDYGAKDVIKICGLHLVNLLTIDSAPIRSAVIIGSANVIRFLKDNENVGNPTHNMDLRKSVVDTIIIKHSKDNNALVRAKALQTMAKVISEELVDHEVVALCMEAAINRITDVAVLPRKYAMNVINIILARYRIICSTEINFKEEVGKRRRVFVELLTRCSLRRSYYIAVLVREFCQQVQSEEIPLPEEQEPIVEAGMNSVRPILVDMIDQERYWDACLLLYHAFQTYGKDVDIAECGKDFAKPELYISYFNNITSGEAIHEQSLGNKSLLETSRDVLMDENDDSPSMEGDEVKSARDMLKYSQGSLRMKVLLPPLIEKLTTLLQAGQPSDRTEVINTIGELVRYGYPVDERITTPVIQAIAALAKESAGDLVHAFSTIFMGDQKLSNADFVKNLFKIMNSVETSTKELLRPILEEMYTISSLSGGAINVLWDAFTKSYQWTLNDAKNAIFVLGAVGKRERNIMLTRIDHIMDVALGDEALEDMEFVRFTLEALLYSFKSFRKGESDVDATYRFPKDHPIFGRLVDILVHGLTKKGNWDTHHHFPRVAELAIQIIYRLNWDHTPATNRLIETVPFIAFKSSKKAQDILTSEMDGTEELYMRFLAVMTALLGAHLNYCDTVVIPELKRRKIEHQIGAVTEQLAKSGALTASQVEAFNNTRKSMLQADASRNTTTGSTSTRRGRGRKTRGGTSVANKTANKTAAAAMAEIEAIIGNVGFDNEMEVVKSYQEKLLEKGIFQQFRRLTLYFTRKIKNIEHPRLKLVIANSLSKLMLVSGESVEKLLDHFVELWHTVPDRLVRVEMLKNLAVLNVRYPNQVERCNVVIKNGLQVGDTSMKMTCLDILGYLALSDILKVRECISEVAICLIDPESRIRELSRDFFNVCAEKDNVISNAVPEVLSQLSKKEDLSKEHFHNIMKYLLVRVKKEKQILALTDTLVTRMRGTATNERLCEDTAFCLSRLAQSEKTFKIIRDQFANYADKLGNDQVFQALVHIVDTLRRNTHKPEFMAKLDDFEREMEDIREKEVEKNRIANAKNRQAQRRGRRHSDASKNASSLMEDSDGTAVEEIKEEDDQDEGNTTKNKKNNKEKKDNSVSEEDTRRSARNKKKNNEKEVDSESEEDTRRSARNKKKNKEKEVDSESEEDTRRSARNKKKNKEKEVDSESDEDERPSAKNKKKKNKEKKVDSESEEDEESPQVKEEPEDSEDDDNSEKDEEMGDGTETESESSEDDD